MASSRFPLPTTLAHHLAAMHARLGYHVGRYSFTCGALSSPALCRFIPATLLVIVIEVLSNRSRLFDYDYEHRFAEHEHELLFIK